MTDWIICQISFPGNTQNRFSFLFLSRVYATSSKYTPLFCPLTPLFTNPARESREKTVNKKQLRIFLCRSQNHQLWSERELFSKEQNSNQQLQSLTFRLKVCVPILLQQTGNRLQLQWVFLTELPLLQSRVVFKIIQQEYL